MEKEGMQPIDWYVYAKDALSHYKGNGFAAFDALKDVQNKFLMDIPSEDRIAWFRDLHETIATTPTSWAVKFQPVLDSQSAFLTNPQEKAAYLETVLSTHLKTGDALCIPGLQASAPERGMCCPCRWFPPHVSQEQPSQGSPNGTKDWKGSPCQSSVQKAEYPIYNPQSLCNPPL